jgi:hypothetical protein
MMKSKIDTVLSRVRGWPEWRQQEAVALLLSLEGESEVYPLSAAQRVDLMKALAEMEQGEVAEIARVREVFRLPA